MSNISVTIFIPAWKSNYLRKAIESALEQDYENLHVLVVDDCSPDPINELCKPFLKNKKFSYKRNKKNLGMAGNWRNGLVNIINSDYVMILCDDDYLIDKHYISKVMKEIEKDNTIVLAHSNYKLLKENNKLISVKRKLGKKLPGEIYFNNFPNNDDFKFMFCTVIFKRSTALKLGAFKEDFLSTDWLLFLKMCFEGNILFLETVSAVYRKHALSIVYTSNPDKKFINLLFLDELQKYVFKKNLVEKKKYLKWKNKFKKKLLSENINFLILKEKKRKKIIHKIITYQKQKLFAYKDLFYYLTILALLIALISPSVYQLLITIRDELKN